VLFHWQIRYIMEEACRPLHWESCAYPLAREAALRVKQDWLMPSKGHHTRKRRLARHMDSRHP